MVIYTSANDETQEQVDARVNALSEPEFYSVVAHWLVTAATNGVEAFYPVRNKELSQFMEEFVDGPEATPNGKTLWALARRMAATHGIDISIEEEKRAKRTNGKGE